MAEAPIYDVIVVGAGIQGSAASYWLLKLGKKTLLLEQFPLPHSRGSSHGHTRITRMAYGYQDNYAEMMPEAYAMIRQLEEETGKQLFINNGFLTVGRKTSPFMQGPIASLQKNDFPHRILTHEEGRKEFPFLTPPSDMSFVLDKTGGILIADKMLSAFQEQCVKHGAELRDNEAVSRILCGPIVTVETSSGGIYKGRSLVLTPGPWAKDILSGIGLHLPLKPERMQVHYWAQKENQPAVSASNSPTFYIETDKGPVYGIPALEYGDLVKVCPSFGMPTHPDDRDNVEDTHIKLAMETVISEYCKTLIPTPSVSETCIFTVSPDIDYIIDTHPRWKNIVVGAGFSGHGFKVAPVVGKLLAELATGLPPSYNLTPYSINRFTNLSKL